MTFYEAFADELEKLAVTAKWISRKMGQDPKKLRVQPMQKHRKSYAKTMEDPKFAKAFGPAVPTGFKSVKTGQVSLVRPSVPKKMRRDPGEFRETAQHEMFHQKSPVLKHSETAASIYGGLKRKGPLKSRIKHAVKGAKEYGIPQDIKTLKGVPVRAAWGAMRAAGAMTPPQWRKKLYGDLFD